MLCWNSLSSTLAIPENEMCVMNTSSPMMITTYVMILSKNTGGNDLRVVGAKVPLKHFMLDRSQQGIWAKEFLDHFTGLQEIYVFRAIACIF